MRVCGQNRDRLPGSVIVSSSEIYNKAGCSATLSPGRVPKGHRGGRAWGGALSSRSSLTLDTAPVPPAPASSSARGGTGCPLNPKSYRGKDNGVFSFRRTEHTPGPLSCRPTAQGGQRARQETSKQGPRHSLSRLPRLLPAEEPVHSSHRDSAELFARRGDAWQEQAISWNIFLSAKHNSVLCVGCYHQSAGCVLIIILISCWQKDNVR